MKKLVKGGKSKRFTEKAKEVIYSPFRFIGNKVREIKANVKASIKVKIDKLKARAEERLNEFHLKIKDIIFQYIFSSQQNFHYYLANHRDVEIESTFMNIQALWVFLRDHDPLDFETDNALPRPGHKKLFVRWRMVGDDPIPFGEDFLYKVINKFYERYYEIYNVRGITGKIYTSEEHLRRLDREQSLYYLLHIQIEELRCKFQVC